MASEYWLALPEAAVLVGLHPRYLLRIAPAKGIRSKRVNSLWLLNENDLLQYLQTRRR